MALLIWRRAGWLTEAGPQPRLLYHYTDRAGLDELIRNGRLDPTRLRAAHRDVPLRTQLTWLTDDMSADTDVARAVAGLPESRAPDIRLTVAVADAQRWPIWAKRHHVHAPTRRQVDAACGQQSEWLWVVARPVDAEEWVAAEDLDTGEQLPLDH